jgi:hypothetical protein
MFFVKIKIWLDKYILIIGLIISTIISVSATIYYFNLHLTVEYSDAASHLDIARRVTDSLTPGIVQVGAAWLPLLHILEIPLSANYILWHTGLSGTIVSMVCFLFSALGTFKLIEYVTDNRSAAFIGMLALVTNANLIYLQTSAMFEPVLIVTLIWSTYYYVKWFREEKLLDLLLCAFFVMLATMTRYDGWFLFFVILCLTFGIVYKKYGYKAAEGKVILYGTAASIGIVLWLLYNKVIFGSMTYFLNGPYSAGAQQILLYQDHKLPTKWNILLSIITYTLAGVNVEGVVVMTLLFVGIVMLAINKRVPIAAKIAMVVIISPYIFNILSLFFGQSVIWIPQLPPYNQLFFNIRYGVFLLPAAAFAIGMLASFSKYIKYSLFFIIIIQAVLFYWYNSTFPSNNGVVTLRDARDSYANKNLTIASWLHNNCNDKYILMSAGGNDPIMFHSGIDLRYYISEGTGKYWHESMIHPAKYAQCVVYGKGSLDRVYIELKNYTELYADFDLKKTISGTYLYVRKKT